MKSFLEWLKRGSNVYIFIIAILFGIIMLQRSCPREIITEGDSTIVYKDTIITHYDTIVKTVTKTEFIHDIIYYPDTVEIPADVDTLNILKNYYAVVHISDTLANDTVLFAKADYVISQNSLQSRDFEYRSRVKTEVIQNVTVVNPLKNKVFGTVALGGRPIAMTGFNSEVELPAKFGVQLGLAYQNKQDKVWYLNVDPLNKELYVGMQFKLFQYGNSK